ncbi:GNAT family N-acetyltransferase [Proteiniborus sp. MB09-C3]|uniref:GNAT family N-acetyltransferase n=1 Tax=Proteiniborus sp. MB09-C3 TaxID=3050072 RepID=UPI0025531C93|nr:GNAT family N-acetyltransferase [Proteiniborus sp. MB09-C3]WIV13646.1 GNAT family N-acetyltransferase [Proteiniborus sp. MB09-C3]
MNIEFKSFSDYTRGILYKQLVDSYSFDSKWQEYFDKDWKSYDDFFYDNLQFTNKCGFITILNGEPIGHISWDPRNMPRYVEIGHNCIVTKYKGNGYGKKQLQEAINRIAQYDGIQKIVVTTNGKLIPAQHNYERIGFKLHQRRENKDTFFSGEYIDYEIIM